MSSVWCKTGYRPEFYDGLVFGKTYPKGEIEQEFEPLRESGNERLLIAKCHALKAYRTASSALLLERTRDADLLNQTRSYGLTFFLWFSRPDIPYSLLPGDECEIWVFEMIDRFPEYFPTIEYCGSGNGAVVHCPCERRPGIGKEWRSTLSSCLLDVNNDLRFKDDICSPIHEGTRLEELVKHLHSHDTPVHSAAFAYLAFMSRDRLPDFGYNFNIHDPEMGPKKPYVNLAKERDSLVAWYATKLTENMRSNTGAVEVECSDGRALKSEYKEGLSVGDKSGDAHGLPLGDIKEKPGQVAIGSIPEKKVPVDGAACTSATKTKRHRVSLSQDATHSHPDNPSTKEEHAIPVKTIGEEYESPIINTPHTAKGSYVYDSQETLPILSGMPLKCLEEEFVALPPLSHDDAYMYPLEDENK
jgi:hypothetical protein